MAKALFGHLPSDPLLVSELARLRRRVSELEAEVARLRAAEDVSEELRQLDTSVEPALT